ncbi:transglutaminase-like domain-containing protein [Paenibacillus tuaregi]|uniref:transglutaminase-like domain-containing protein n=1 Tax=Paenibacillus tuaregi TaxID=1816681 RepID=UPI000839512A|nr:transglutaminase-like domain-containing protein [Paenibacillus tuaregi]
MPRLKKSFRQTILSFKEAGEHALLSLFIFGLFREWLEPIAKLLGPEAGRSLNLFYILTVVLLILGCFKLPGLVQFLLPPVLCVTSMVYLYGGSRGIGWLEVFLQMIAQDISGVADTGRLNGLSPEVRMFVLLLGWALLVVSVQLLAVSRQSIMLFFMATLLYLLSLELGLGLSIYSGLVRAVLIGLLLQALLFVLRLQEEDEIPVNPHPAVIGETDTVTGNKSRLQAFPSVRVFAVVISIVLGSILGLASLVHALPVQSARAFSFQQVMASLEAWTKSAVPANARVIYNLSGYGSDDGELGGPLTLRNEELFTAISPFPTYFRGESKSEYTGRGWEEPDPQMERLNVNGQVPVRDGSRPRGREFEQTIVFKEPQSGKVPLAGGGIPTAVKEVVVGNFKLPLHDLQAFPSSGLVLYDEPGQSLSRYSLKVRDQYAAPELLRASGGDDPADVEGKYLGLPASLPTEVRTLGANLTKGSTNRYDSVKKVETYLKDNYRYDLQTSAPPVGSDFAADFLFVQKKGYCDHFSTAMTVILRTQGIPARWVKGYASGQPESGNTHAYAVSYADAHSWVEVYFPEVGWVPFDPTPGFEAPQGAAALENAGGGRSPHHFFAQWMQAAGQGLKSASAFFSGIALWMLKYLLELIVGGLVCSLFFMLWKYRPYLTAYWAAALLPYWRRGQFPGRVELLRTSDYTWNCLYARYGRKPPGLTGREYVQNLSGLCLEERTRLDQFVNVWEALKYGGKDLDRSATLAFLRQCRKMAAVWAKSEPDLP